MSLLFPGGDAVCPWGDDERWLAERRTGLGASEVAAALGLSHWRTSWQVWAEKTGAMPDEFAGNAATELGTALEPWLIEQSRGLLDQVVSLTPSRMYCHREHYWRLASPDAVAEDGSLVECKTGGLISLYVDEWSETEIPTAYDLQCRWQMHVTGAPRVYLVGLVAGLGLRVWPVERDLELENEIVEMASDWWTTYVIGNREPPLVATDSAVMNDRWADLKADAVPLDDTDMAVILEARREAVEAEKNARARREELDALAKRLLGPHEAGTVDGRVIATWRHEAGRISTKAAVKAGIDLEPYRGEQVRVLRWKDVI